MSNTVKDLLERSLNAVLGIGGIVGIIMVLGALAKQGPLYQFLFG